MSVQPIREGFHTLTPYLVTKDANRLIKFIRDALDGELSHQMNRPDGTVMHAELRVGDSMVMVGEASEEFGARTASIYLYTTDCDAIYERALANGGVSVSDVTDMPSGERYGGVIDPCGNIWWVATHIEDVSPAEEIERWKNFRR